MKSTVSEVRNLLDGLNDRLSRAMEMISEPEDGCRRLVDPRQQYAK